MLDLNMNASVHKRLKTVGAAIQGCAATHIVEVDALRVVQALKVGFSHAVEVGSVSLLQGRANGVAHSLASYSSLSGAKFVRMV
ncbi:hypothetical protein L484_005226 [Morus notabilis]|uniref:Uncharacterized protein n=1 Tax=Morus notabilis TaxID=981085 RepID=W9QUH4_9ROSA|nr:hypothetical protein L484_005226 [Morus notabilis]